MQQFCENREISQNWKNAKIIPISKKGSKMVCGNYQGIFLLVLVEKVLSCVLLNSINKHITPDALFLKLNVGSEVVAAQ